MTTRRARGHAHLVAVTLATGLAAGCADDAPVAPATDAGTIRADAGPPINTDPFCAARPRIALCEDFDGAALPGIFDRQETSGGALVVDDAQAASRPRSLRATTQGAGSAVLALTHVEGQKFRVFLQMWMEPITADDGALELVRIDLANGSTTSYALAFGVDAAGRWTSYEERGDEPRRIFDATPEFYFEEWMSVRFDVNLVDPLNGDQPTLKLRFGGDEFGALNVLRPPALRATPTVSIGARSTGTSDWLVRYDNVTFEVD